MYPNNETYPNDYNEPGTSVVMVDQVTVSPSASDASRFMAGAVVGGAAAVTTIPQLVATAYKNGVVVPGQSFSWESSNSGVVKVDQNGNCTRVTNNQALSYDSNGMICGGNEDLESHLGGLSTITATWLRPDGSASGVRGDIKICVQAAGQRNFGSIFDIAQPVRLIVLLDGVTNEAGVINMNNDAGGGSAVMPPDSAGIGNPAECTYPNMNSN
jgi:hypothetical protein